MKTIILVSLCLLVAAINADKSHKHQDKLLKSGHEEHKTQSDVQPVNKDETDTKIHNPTNEQTVTKPAGSGRKHRNHHGKNKKGGNTEIHTGRSRKVQTKPNKHNGQRTHNNKHHGRKHGHGKQTQQK